MNRAIVISVLVIIGVLATYVSRVLFLTSEVTRVGTSTWTYGFPLPWITTVAVYSPCPGPYFSCQTSSTTSYSWIAFAGDVLFYIAVGYGLIVFARNTWKEAINRAKEQAEQLRQTEQPESEEESGTVIDREDSVEERVGPAK